MPHQRLKKWGGLKRDQKASKARVPPAAGPPRHRLSTSRQILRPKPDGIVATPYPIPDPDSSKRQFSAIDLIESTARDQFHIFTQEATFFDLVYELPAGAYGESWKTLSGISSRLLDLTGNEHRRKFEKVSTEIFSGVESALTGDREVTMLVRIWRICDIFLRKDVFDRDDRLVYRLFGSVLRARWKWDLEPEHGIDPEKDPLIQLCICVLRCPLDEMRELLRQCYRRSIECLKQYRYFAGRNFTVPQMTTDYLRCWDGKVVDFRGLTDEFRALIQFAEDTLGPQSWRTIVCQHQFLHFTFEIKHDETCGRELAVDLHTRCQDILLRRLPRPFEWDAVARALVFAAKILIISYRRHSTDGRILARRYHEGVRSTLLLGNEECRRQVRELPDPLG